MEVPNEVENPTEFDLWREEREERVVEENGG